jgi:hypothetical protein
MIGTQNIGPPTRVYNIRIRKKIENKERAHVETHYQKELEDVKNNMAQMVNLLEQILSSS